MLLNLRRPRHSLPSKKTSNQKQQNIYKKSRRDWSFLLNRVPFKLKKLQRKYKLSPKLLRNLSKNSEFQRNLELMT